MSGVAHVPRCTRFRWLKPLADGFRSRPVVAPRAAGPAPQIRRGGPALRARYPRIECETVFSTKRIAERLKHALADTTSVSKAFASPARERKSDDAATAAGPLERVTSRPSTTTRPTHKPPSSGAVTHTCWSAQSTATSMGASHPAKTADRREPSWKSAGLGPPKSDQ